MFASRSLEYLFLGSDSNHCWIARLWSFDFELGWHRSICSELRRNCFVELFSLGNILRQRQHSNGIIGTYGYQMEDRWSLFSPVERRWKVRSLERISRAFDGLFPIRYYECTIDDVLDDGTCTIVYDGFESAPLTVVRVCIDSLPALSTLVVFFS